jgi:hypothetical protein
MDHTDEFPWATQLETDEAGHWRRIAWTLTARGLREALLESGESSPARSLSFAEAKSVLLLTDVITLDSNLVSMSLFVSRDPDVSNSLVIEARITAEQNLGPSLRATLRWGSHTLIEEIEEAQAIFRGIRTDSLIDLQSSEARTDLQIALERPNPSVR